ncbi:MAG: peptidyl-prolyl cis-trans isomerase [Puniceicoccales bacterium]|jgi:parvulin-like peptidyl-prolyl isomerase|nr:peptidyl-prolyl cis-trans isomerase [Puniceicoccales bacterium]
MALFLTSALAIPLPPTGIAARVNEAFVTVRQINEALAESLEEDKSLSPAETKQKILQRLVEHTLIVQEFENQKGKKEAIFDTYLEEHIQGIIKEHFNGQRELLSRHLRQKGQTFGQFRQEIKESIIVREMINQKTKAQNEISPKAVREYYQNHLSRYTQPATVKVHQLEFGREDTLTTDEEIPISKFEKAVEQINRKVSFEELAASLRLVPSEDVWLEASEMNPHLAQAAFSLRPGEYNGPIEIGHRYFILLVVDKKEQQVIPMSEVQEEIESLLLKEWNHKIYQRWIATLREKSFIQLYPLE